MKKECISEEDLHRYTARYDIYIDTGCFGVPGVKKKTYVCDVCEKCGDVINRPNQELDKKSI
jgi:hypothetical protein